MDFFVAKCLQKMKKKFFFRNFRKIVFFLLHISIFLTWAKISSNPVLVARFYYIKQVNHENDPNAANPVCCMKIPNTCSPVIQ